jgi:hypothetical protein
LKSSCSSSIEKNGECASKAKTNLHHNVCVFKGFLNLLESVKLCFSCTVDVCVCSELNDEMTFYNNGFAENGEWWQN